MNIALFDLDGTITRKDTLLGFMLFSNGLARSLIKLFLLSPVLFRYAVGRMSNSEAKERLIGRFFGGWPFPDFNDKAEKYARTRLPRLVRPEAGKALARHREQGDTIVVVSASLENWIEPWCRANGYGLVATRIEVSGGRLTGRFATPNCHGEQKMIRIRERYDLSQYEHIYAYGNSSGDRDMLAAADVRFYKWKRLP